MVWEQRPKKGDPSQGAEKGDEIPNMFGSLALFHTVLALSLLLFVFFD